MNTSLRALSRALLLSLTALWLVSCSTTASTSTKLTDSSGSEVALKWVFEYGGKDKYRVPKTDVFLMIGDKRHFIQDEASGGDFQACEPAAWNALPSSALTACYAGFAGTGDAFYVKKAGPGELVVFKGRYEEVYGFSGFKEHMRISY